MSRSPRAFARNAPVRLVDVARTFAVVFGILALAFLGLYAVFAAIALIVNGSLSDADIEWLRNGVLGTLAISALIAFVVAIADPIGSWRKARRERRELAARAALRARREKAHEEGVADPAAERGHVLAAAMTPEDRIRARRFAIRRIRWRIVRRTGLLPVYIVVALVAFMSVWGPVADLLGLAVPALIVVGAILAVGIVVATHVADAWGQASTDPLLLLGTVVDATSSTSAESFGVDGASSSVHKVRIELRAAQSLRVDGSLGPAPEKLHGAVELSSFDATDKRIRTDEHVALLTSGETRVIGLLEDAFPTPAGSFEPGAATPPR